MVAKEPGIYRRRIIADAEGQRVTAGVEDDFHHYEMTLEHDGFAVTSIGARSHRTPWLTCSEAQGPLDQLVGQPIVTRPTGLPDPHFQCTHMFELALVAVAQAARGGRRSYEVSVPMLQLDGRRTAQLHRDDELLFDWCLQGDTLTAPAEFAGHNLRTLLRRVEDDGTTDDDTLEAIRVLRRSLHVSNGRVVSSQGYRSAADIPQMRGACYVFQPVRSGRALRDWGSPRDFSLDASALLRDFPVVQGGRQ